MPKKLSGFQACMRRELKGRKAKARTRKAKTKAQVSFGAAARRCSRLAKTRSRKAGARR